MPEKQKELKDLSTKYANLSLGEVTVSQVRQRAAADGGSRADRCSYPPAATTAADRLLTRRTLPPQTVGGGRDVKCMLWDTSLLDSHEVRARTR